MSVCDGETHYARGVKGEALACDYLRRQGFEILQQRYKTKFGEVDIIARMQDLICFVEVKVRGSLEEALEAVTPRSRKRIEQSALFFISENPDVMSCDMRFDVVAITQGGNITHLDNAWEACS
ncbi:MAG: YraN family protein [Alphaproteobacteria bacterium]